jgi:hypothetical protein
VVGVEGVAGGVVAGARTRDADDRDGGEERDEGELEQARACHRG